MKRLLGRALAIICTPLAAALLLTGTAEGQATRIDFTGTTTCVVTSPGEVKVADGNTQSRGETSTCQNVIDLPNTSVSYTVGNGSFDSTGNGRLWGTIRIEDNLGDVFEGSYQGELTGGIAYTLDVVAQSLGPEHAKLFATFDAQFVAPGVAVGDTSGTLLTPP
jgi:hypothetical protein